MEFGYLAEVSGIAGEQGGIIGKSNSGNLQVSGRGILVF
jgi:hypothetical protein